MNREIAGRRTCAPLFALILLLALSGCTTDSSVEQDIKGQKVAYEITANRLTRDYGSDAAGSDSKYRGKVLLVSGVVTKTDPALGGGVSFLMGAGELGSGVRCKFAPAYKAKVEKLKGDEVTVKGRCDGWNMGEVILRGCTTR
jgi:hypothetical protein